MRQDEALLRECGANLVHGPHESHGYMFPDSLLKPKLLLSVLSPKLVIALLPNMWHKRQRSQDAEAPAGKRLRDNLLDLYGSGDVPADRTQALLEDAAAFADSMGSGDMQDLRRRPTPGNERNAARDLRRKLLKTSHWPPVYIAQIPMWSTKKKEMSLQKVAFLLPHEVLHTLGDLGSLETLTDTAGLDATNLRRHASILQDMGQPFISVSLWGDGVPFSWDRKKSADMWCFSLPGMGHKPYQDLRIVITSVPHESVTRESQDGIMEVLSWSFACLAKGLWPEQRHTGMPWEPEDFWRQKKGGQELVRGAVLEVKGDWKQMSHCFGVPSWTRSPHMPICWRCNASKQSLKTEHGLTSGWLQPENRLTHFDALQGLVEDGGTLSPIWKMPWMHMEALRLDWLHVADQGITPVFLGGLFHLMLGDKSIGNNQDERCKWLWMDIQAYYGRAGTQDMLHELTTTMVKPKKGSIELSGSGAQVRALVPYGLQLVNSWVELDVERTAAKTCMFHLSKCYDFLSQDVDETDGSFLTHALGFQRNLQGLHLTNPKRWQIRPKLHLFLELAKEGGHPSSSWNYREESFGGSVSKQSHRWGGWKSPLAMSRACLTKFCSKERVPKILPP